MNRIMVSVYRINSFIISVDRIHIRYSRSRESVVCIASSCMLEAPGSNPGTNKSCVSSPKSSRPALRPTSLLFGGYRDSFPGVKQPRLEVRIQVFRYMMLWRWVTGSRRFQGMQRLYVQGSSTPIRRHCILWKRGEAFTQR